MNWKLVLLAAMTALTIVSFAKASGQQLTWADFGNDSHLTAKDYMPAQEAREPKYNLMAPDPWAQWR